MSSTPASNPTPALDRFFGSLHRSPVRRSSDGVIAGVCAGIAQRWGISTAIVRVVAVLLALFGPAVALYLVAWLLLPDAGGRVRLESAVRKGDGSSIVLLIVTVLAILPDGMGHARFTPYGVVVLVLLVVLVLVGVNKGWFRGGGQRRQVAGGDATAGPPPPYSGPPAGPPPAAPEDRPSS